MRFKIKSNVIAALLLMPMIAGCGKFGQKDEIEKIFQYNGLSGCLNQIGPNTQKYLSGEIEEVVLKGTWACLVDSLGLFKKFIKGSGDQGVYTQEDMRAFLSKFLLTDKTVSKKLMQATLELKSTFFGGSANSVSNDELDEFISFLRAAEEESLKILPILQRKSKNPDRETAVALSDGIENAFINIGKTLKSKQNMALPISSIQTLLNELATIYGVDKPRDWTELMSAAKAFLIGGRNDVFEGKEWPRIFSFIGALGGPVAAIATVNSKLMPGISEPTEFYNHFAHQIRTALESTFNAHDNKISLTLIDRLIDAVPVEYLDINKAVLEETLRPVFSDVLVSDSPDTINRASIDKALGEFDKYTHARTHLSRIFSMIRSVDVGASAQEFAEAAHKYSESLSAAQVKEVDELVTLSIKFRPLFHQNDGQISFSPMTQHTYTNLSTLHLNHQIGKVLLTAYASLEKKDGVTENQLKEILNKYIPLLGELKKIDPTDVQFYQKRFAEGNLFTYVSNGDKYIDLNEATYYLSFLSSVGVLSDRIMKDTEAVCPGEGQDVYGWAWMDINCFRKNYFNNYRKFWDHFPELIRYYEDMSGPDKESLHLAMEKGSRRYGFSNYKIGRYDVEGFAGLIHYLESMYQRFDDNADQELDLDDVMRAYPVFKGTLAVMGGLDPSKDWLLKAVFTYMVRTGSAPTLNFTGTLQFGAWIAAKPIWKKLIHADRSSIFKVVAVLSSGIDDTGKAIAEISKSVHENPEAYQLPADLKTLE